MYISHFALWHISIEGNEFVKWLHDRLSPHHLLSTISPAGLHGRHKSQLPGSLCNIGYPSETHLKLKSRHVSFADILLRSCLIVVNFCIEHGSDTAVLCARSQNDYATETDITQKRFREIWVEGDHKSQLPGHIQVFLGILNLKMCLALW